MTQHRGMYFLLSVCALSFQAIAADVTVAPPPTPNSTAPAQPTPAAPHPPAQVAPVAPPIMQPRINRSGPQVQSSSAEPSQDVKDMTNPAYLLKLANVHLEFGAVDRAEPLLRTALEKSKDANQKQAILQALGACLVKKGDSKGAIEQLESSYAGMTNPTEKGRTGLALADLYIRNRENDKAEKLLVELARPNKDRQDDNFQQQSAFRMLTQLWQSSPGKIDGAITDAEATLAKTPDDTATLEHLVILYSELRHDAVKAIPYVEKLLALHPDDKGMLFRLTGLYQQAKQFDKAIAIYKKFLTAPGIRKDELRADSFQVGMLLVQDGKKDEAVAWMKDNYVKEISGSRDYSLLAMFYEQAGMRGEAEAALDQEFKLATAPEEKLDAHQRLADMAFRGREYEKAEEIAKSILTENKENVNACTRANALLKRLEMERAKILPEKPPVANKPVERTPPANSVSVDSKTAGANSDAPGATAQAPQDGKTQPAKVGDDQKK